MADVFLSYRHSDAGHAAVIARLLENHGWSVWWDPQIRAGDHWDEVIEKELGAANCVVVVWSPRSVDSRWVRAEANDGLERGILVPVSIDSARPPLAFRLVQTIDLAGWTGDATIRDAQLLTSAVQDLVGQPKHICVPTIASTDTDELVGMPRVLTAASADEARQWQSASHTKDSKTLEVFLERYPNSRYARQAKARLAQMRLSSNRVLLLDPRRWSLRRWGAITSASLVLAILLVGALSRLQHEGTSVTGGSAEAIRPAKSFQIEDSRAVVGKVFHPNDALAVVAIAASLTSAGEIEAARELLGRVSHLEHKDVAFALAETFDPNVLAAWGVSGNWTDVDMARSLYAKAISAGHERAKSRLEGLR